MALLPGADLVGCSINVCGQVIPTAPKPVFDMGAMKKVVIQLSGKEYDCPERAKVDQETATMADEIAIVSESEEDFSTKFSATFGLSGSYDGFSGQFNSYFRQNTSVTHSYYYSLRGTTMQMYTVQLSSDIKPYLLPAVKEAIEEALASKKFVPLFENWGTHYVASAVGGGVAMLSISTEKSSTVTEISVGASIEAEYLAIVSAKASVDYSQVDKAFMSSSKTECHPVGGDIAYGSKIMEGEGNYDKWAASVIGLPQVISYRPFNKPSVPDNYLVGIWTLAETQQQRDMIYDAFRKYLQSMSVPFVIAGAASGNAGTPYGDIDVGGDLLYRNDWEALRLCVLDGQSLTVLLNQSYRTYDHAQQGTMARAMAPYINRDVIVIVVSTDSGWPDGVIDAALVQQLAICGGSSTKLSGGHNRREPYCLIGKPGIGGIDVLHPSGTPRAAITGTLVRTPNNRSYQVVFSKAA